MQIGRRKKVLTERASELFDLSHPVDVEKLTDPLYREIGRLKMDGEELKKGEELNVAEQCELMAPSDSVTSVRRQCQLLALNRSMYDTSPESVWKIPHFLKFDRSSSSPLLAP